MTIPRKRVPGEGTVYYHKGRQQYVAQKTVQGRRVTAYGKTAAEARRNLAARLNQALHLPGADVRLSEFLAAWLRWRLDTGSMRPETVKIYAEFANRYILPHLGHRTLADLRTRDIDAAYLKLAKRLQPSTLRHVHTILRSALRQAVRWNLLTENPATKATLPVVPYREPEVWTPEEVERFLATAHQTPHYAMFYTALTTGLRPEELRGLQWGDIDLERGTLTVRRALGMDRNEKPLKTSGSYRTITLPPDTVDVLRAYRPRNAQPGDWVFVQPRTGGPWGHRRLWDAFRRICRRAGVPAIPLRNLRHQHATLLLQAGVDLASVARRLGHTNLATAPRHYIRLAQEAERRGAIPLADLLRSQPNLGSSSDCKA